MAQLTLKVRKVKGINPKTKQEGLVARVVTNGKQSFEDICELAGLNTTMNVAELEAAGKLILQAAARELKNGKIVDLGPIGTVYPSVNGKWVEKAEDLTKSDLTLKTVYRPSDDINAAVRGASLSWATEKDEKEGTETPENGDDITNGGDNTGDNTGGGDNNLEG